MTRLDVEIAHQATDAALTRKFPGTSPVENDSFDSMAIEQLPISEVPLRSLERGFFLRGSGTDPAHVKLLADAASSAELPPILVQAHSSRIVDGMHRLEVAKLRGEKTIRARFINCSDQQAFILAVKSNTSHGLPLSRTDRIFGAKRILTWHPDWSDRALGAATGLSAKSVASLRRASADGVQEFGKRLGRDGKRRPVTSGEGRKRAAEYIAACPDASLREIAREADVSLGTVQDVRARIRSGMDPLTTGGRRRPPLEAVPSRATVPADQATREDPVNTRDTRRNAQNMTWEEISSKLVNDPSLKYTESGRTFIRWMAVHVIQGGQWKEFIDSVPPHWLRDISRIAIGISDEWRQFAEQLRSKQASAV